MAFRSRELLFTFLSDDLIARLIGIYGYQSLFKKIVLRFYVYSLRFARRYTRSIKSKTYTVKKKVSSLSKTTFNMFKK